MEAHQWQKLFEMNSSCPSEFIVIENDKYINVWILVEVIFWIYFITDFEKPFSFVCRKRKRKLLSFEHVKSIHCCLIGTELIELSLIWFVNKGMKYILSRRAQRAYRTAWNAGFYEREPQGDILYVLSHFVMFQHLTKTHIFSISTVKLVVLL
jgi:hypothetical protein